MKKSSLIFFYAFAILFPMFYFSCKSDIPNSDNNPVKSVDQKTESPTKDKVVPSSEEEKTKEQVNLNQLDFMSAFLKNIEDTHCMDEYKLIDGCEELHEVTMRTDYLDKKSPSSKFPYNGNFSWEDLKKHKDFNLYWSDLCGFYLEEQDIKINYYCPNLKGEMNVWLEKQAKDNELIEEFLSIYSETQTVTPYLQKSFVFRIINELDLKDPSHRAFYWIYHITLAEEYFGNVKLSKLMEAKN